MEKKAGSRTKGHGPSARKPIGPPHWTKVQYLFAFRSRKVHSIFSERFSFPKQFFESIGRGLPSGDAEGVWLKNRSRYM
jgi:hypothetical protein